MCFFCCPALGGGGSRMKVVLYALLGQEGSSCRWTLDSEVDRWYWLSPGGERLREEQGLNGEGGRTERRPGGEHLGMGQAGRASEYGDRYKAAAAHKKRKILAWNEPLPLGAAIDAADRWQRLAGKTMDEAAGEALLRRCVRDAMEAEGGESNRREGAKAGVSGAVRMWVPLEDDDGRDGEARLVRERTLALQPAASGAASDKAWRQTAAFAALGRQARRDAEQLLGRALHIPEALALLGVAEWRELAPRLQLAALLGLARLEAAVAPAPPDGRWRLRAASAKPRPRRCLRCGSGEARLRRTPCAACGRRACAYCEACLAMGRSRECGLLILGTPPSPSAASPLAAPKRPMAARLAPWNLSPAQQAAAAAALRCIEGAPPEAKRRALPAERLREAWRRLAGRFAAALAPQATPRRMIPLSAPTRPADAPARFLPQRQFLLWAVTGAGKTEMIFPLVAAALERGGRALIATPRRDVVLELDPRIRRAFPAERVVTLYGGSPQRWESGGITLATTHQLFRFREAFDLVIVDEIDAFPYHGDPQLHYAASHSMAPDGTTVLLSATPPAKLRAMARRGSLPHARVPVRFHGHPLPEPVMLRIPTVDRLLNQLRFPPTLRRALQASLDRGAQLFVFVQRIRHVEPLVARLRREFKAVAIDGTSSKDEARTDKVQRFRDGDIRLLVTTTILERGVTIPRSDVFILDADGRLFDDASLIQMAGRAGRSLHDPAGRVYFCAAAFNNAQRSATKEIRAMNRIAAKRGYLKASGAGKRALWAPSSSSSSTVSAVPSSSSVSSISSVPSSSSVSSISSVASSSTGSSVSAVTSSSSVSAISGVSAVASSSTGSSVSAVTSSSTASSVISVSSALLARPYPSTPPASSVPAAPSAPSSQPAQHALRPLGALPNAGRGAETRS
ncbi:DEAD/DEAH box helicase [Paenibacillus aurantiacus]|uniref:DEAD/DEAH box helicase n=1 Tax=Paenibacillus aurantiacus TaxID=1936118 RepID=A0ABV5KQ72_9BACL